MMMNRLATRLIRPSSIVLRGGGRPATTTVRFFESITYSGGQASEGQGGFYGSGGARVLTKTEEHRPELLALASDVQTIESTMQQVEILQHSLQQQENSISSKAIEIRSSIKKLMTSPELLKCLNRLEVQGEPVWGLSSQERELIIEAREKVNEC